MAIFLVSIPYQLKTSHQIAHIIFNISKNVIDLGVGVTYKKFLIEKYWIYPVFLLREVYIL